MKSIGAGEAGGGRTSARSRSGSVSVHGRDRPGVRGLLGPARRAATANAKGPVAPCLDLAPFGASCAAPFPDIPDPIRRFSPMHAYRTHNLRPVARRRMSARRVRLSGWVHRKRDHGNLLFIDLRDHYGVTQGVMDISSPACSAGRAHLKVKPESVVTVTGKVVARSAETVNAKLATGAGRAADPPRWSPCSRRPRPCRSRSTDGDFPEDICACATASSTCAPRSMHRNIVLRSRGSSPRSAGA